MRNKVGDCRYNPGVGCFEQLGCESCGWNPAATTERKKMIRSVALRDVMGVLRGQDRVVIIRQVGPHECEGVAEGTVRELCADKRVEGYGERMVKRIAADMENGSDDGTPVLVITI